MNKGEQKKEAKAGKEAAKIEKKAPGAGVLAKGPAVKSGKRRKGTEMLGEDKRNAAQALRLQMEEAANDDNQ